MLLKKGSKGELVKTMQKLLLSVGYQIEIDGIYGAETERIVKLFQEDALIKIDGICGNQTYNALINMSKKLSQNYSEKIVWLPPLRLKSAIVNKSSANIVKTHKSFVNSNFFSTKGCIGWLISEGKILNRRDEYKTWKGLTKGTLIVLKTGKVIVNSMSDKEIATLADSNQIWFACQGFINAKPEGFDPQEVGRKCIRPILIFDEINNKVGICVFKGTSDMSKDVAKKYKCDKWVCLDGGGSTNLYVDGKGLFVTSRVLNSIIYW